MRESRIRMPQSVAHHRSSRRNPLTYLTKPYDHLLTPTRCNPYLGNHRFRVASGVWYAWWVRAFCGIPGHDVPVFRRATYFFGGQWRQRLSWTDAPGAKEIFKTLTREQVIPADACLPYWLSPPTFLAG